MTIRSMIEEAVTERSAQKAGRVSDFLRSRGFTYAKILALVQEACPQFSAAEWDALLYEADVL